MQSSLLRSAIAAACLIMSVTSGVTLAGTLLQDGNPAKPGQLATYGMQVPTSQALQTILPSGWTAMVSPDAVLNGKVSWGPSDTWLDVMSRVADRSNAGFLVDWNARKVIVRPVPATITEGITRTEIHQEASTPLPQLAPAHTPPAPAALPGPAVVAPTPAVATPAIAVARPVAAVAPLPAPMPPAPIGHPVPAAPSAGPARSFSNVSIREVINAIAQNNGLVVKMSAPNVKLPGPVTLKLAGNATEDVQLLQRALGPVAPLAVTIYRASHELIVEGSSEASLIAFDARPVIVEKQGFFARLLAHKPAPGATSAAAPTAPAPVLAAQSKPAVPASPPVAASSAPVPGALAIGTPVVAANSAPVGPPAPVVAKVVFDVQGGERLSDAISRFLKVQGWDVSWQSQNDLEASGAIHIEAETISGILKQILPQLGLVADLYKSNHVAVIRPQSVETPPEGAQ
jgi:hypothetical protein